MIKVKLISPDLFLSKSLAIIGSSGSLKERNYAKQIDSYVDVVRFNRAPTIGFEKIAGSKRTLTVTNNRVFANVQLRKKSGWKQDNVNFVLKLRNTKVLFFSPKNKNWTNRHKNIHKSVEPFIVNFEKMLKLVGVGKKHPTIGFGFIKLCVKSGLKPHLYGFDTTPRTRDHYWEDRDNDTSYHNVTYEQNMLRRMDKEGVIVLHG